MNRSILNPFTLRKRFVIIIAVMLAMFAAFGLIACGDNDIPTGGNGNPPPPTLLFTLDTFKLEYNGITGRDTTMFSNTLSKSVKIEFNTETNCTLSDNPTVSFKYANWEFIPIDSLNTFKSFTQTRDTAQTTAVELSLFMNSQTLRYLKFTNVKVYYIN